MQHNRFDFWTRLKPACIGSAAIKIVVIPLSLAVAKLLSDVTTQALAGNVESVIKNAVFAAALLIALAAFQTAGDIRLRRREALAKNLCRIDFLETLLKNPLEKLFRADHGELVENLNDDMTACVERFTQSYPSVVSSAVAALGYTAFLALNSPVVAASLPALALLQLLPPLIVKKHMQINYDECRDMEAAITDHLVEALGGFDTIKLYGLKNWWQAKMTAYHKKYLRVGHKVDTIAAAQRSMYRMLNNILKFGTYALMGIYVILSWCAMDVAVQAIYLSGSLFGAVNSLFSAIPEIAVSRNAEKRINKWVEPATGAGKKADMDVRQIVMKNLHSSYGEKQIFTGMNSCFELDKNYMIEGDNGAGKTTLLHLMTGLVLPESGGVRIGEADPGCPEQQVGPQTMLYIPQNGPEYGFDAAALFDMFDEARQEKLFEIAKRFGLTEENIKGCAIRDLSGGERKKVFLSIGFALCPQWLLLDEPSNSLDKYGRDVLRELIGERKGTIVISHDTSLRLTADRLMKIEGGCMHDEKE